MWYWRYTQITQNIKRLWSAVAHAFLYSIQKIWWQLRKHYRLTLAAVALSLVVTFLVVVNFSLPSAAMYFANQFAKEQSIGPAVAGSTLGVATAEPATLKIKAINTEAHYIDKRAYVLNEYFRLNGSPLYGTGEIFVNKCLQYQAPKDCTIVAAIARAETDLCKYSSSASYYNCWGFGGAGPNRIRFNSWDESIDRVYRSLSFSYGYRFMINPSLMADTFCGSEPGCTGWGPRVLHFVEEINDLSIHLGMGDLIALRDR